MEIITTECFSRRIDRLFPAVASPHPIHWVKRVSMQVQPEPETDPAKVKDAPDESTLYLGGRSHGRDVIVVEKESSGTSRSASDVRAKDAKGDASLGSAHLRRFSSSKRFHLPSLKLASYTVDKHHSPNALISKVLIAALSYLFLLCFIGPDEMAPNGGPGFCVCLIWVCSMFFGSALEQLQGGLGILGMIISGILLKNLPGDPISDMPDSWSAAIRAGGLCCILMRSGLEMDVAAIRRIGMTAVKLTFLPGIVEALVCGGMAVVIFGMPPALGISLGFILAAVSPAVVVIGMFSLERMGEYCSEFVVCVRRLRRSGEAARFLM